jgi:hypothetical protein
MPVAAFGPSVGSIKRSCHTRRLSLKIPLLVFLTFDRDFLTGLVIKVDFFPAPFLDQLITRQILLHLIRGDNRPVLGGLGYRGCGLCAVNGLGWGLNSRRGRGLSRALLNNGPLVINVNYPLPGISPDGHGVGPGFVANYSRNKAGVGNVSFADHGGLDWLGESRKLDLVSKNGRTSEKASPECSKYNYKIFHILCRNSRLL